MYIKQSTIGWVLAATAGLCPTPGAAQTLDDLGDRASALGAFVAVADDVSAVVWNPAGLVNGPFFNVALDFGRSTRIPHEPLADASRPAGKTEANVLALGVLPLGVSYFRGRRTEVSPAGIGSAVRQDAQAIVRSLSTTHVGVTVLHTVVEGLTVGATPKLVRGSFATGRISADSWEDAFERADRLAGEARTTGDIDIGALATVGRARLGIVARNLAAPTFEAGRDAIEIRRHVRMGAAWGDNWPGTARLIVALDADLTRVAHAEGERRDVAAGVERWFRRQTLGIRGGVRASTVDGARPLASAGVSYAVRGGIYMDVYAARGREAGSRWGIAGRLTY